MRDRFDRLKKSPLYWYEHSYKLRVAAAVLSYGMQPAVARDVINKYKLGSGFDVLAISPVKSMLLGMSLELIYKAIIAAKCERPPKTHNLAILADNAGLVLSKVEKDTLRLFSASIVWAGRYPVPNEIEEMENWSSLIMDLAFEPWTPVSGSKLKGRKPKKDCPTDFDSFDRFWMNADNKFWKLHRENDVCR